MMALISLCLQEATTDLNHNTPTAPTQGRRKDKESKDKECHGQANEKNIKSRMNNKGHFFKNFWF